MARFESPSVSTTPRGSAAAGGDAECTVVWLQGEHDAATKEFLTATLARAAELDDANLLVDLGAVTFMDAATVGVIVAAHNRLGTRTLEIRAPSPGALLLLELCGLTHLIRPAPIVTVHPTGVAGALQTWIAVPSRPSSPPTQDAAKTPAVQRPNPATLSEVDSGGP